MMAIVGITGVYATLPLFWKIDAPSAGLVQLAGAILGLLTFVLAPSRTVIFSKEGELVVEHDGLFPEKNVRWKFSELSGISIPRKRSKGVYDLLDLEAQAKDGARYLTIVFDSTEQDILRNIREVSRLDVSSAPTESSPSV
jgi:hypothetical protein